MTSPLSLLKLKATKDKYKILGPVLINKGKEYDAVQVDNLVLIADNIIIAETIKSDGVIDGFEVLSREPINAVGDITIDTISELLKTKQVEKWVYENLDPNDIKLVRFTERCGLVNNGGTMAGVEHFNIDDVFVGLVSPCGDIMIQKRKGVIFYLNSMYSNAFELKDLKDEKGHSYTILKELKFMYENDHKRS